MIISVIVFISIIIWLGYDVLGIFILGIILILKADWINNYNLGLVREQEKTRWVRLPMLRWYLEHERRLDEGKWGIKIWKLGGIFFIIISLALLIFSLI
jgi:hypothetical protein